MVRLSSFSFCIPCAFERGVALHTVGVAAYPRYDYIVTLFVRRLYRALRMFFLSQLEAFDRNAYACKGLTKSNFDWAVLKLRRLPNVVTFYRGYASFSVIRGKLC